MSKTWNGIVTFDCMHFILKIIEPEKSYHYAFQISTDGNRQTLTPQTVPGDFSTIVEVGCPLEGLSTAPPGYFAHGYAVSISNDGGENLSDERELIIYNSACQEPVAYSSDKFSVELKVGTLRTTHKKL